MHACWTGHLDRKSSSLLLLLLLLLLACLQFEVRESCVAQPAGGVVRPSSPRSSSPLLDSHALQFADSPSVGLNVVYRSSHHSDRGSWIE